MTESSHWNIQPSIISLSTINPILKITDSLTLNDCNPNKQKIILSIGDPSIFGNMKPHSSVIAAITNAAKNADKTCGYAPPIGLVNARNAIAEIFTNKNSKITIDDIIITSGCSQAVDICVSGIANNGDNILFPSPGYSIYVTACGSRSVEPRFYHLLQDKNWEVDLIHLESQIDSKTKAILICNPSNPCGSVYSSNHLLEILKIAEKYKLPIISDEIYGDIVFNGVEFVPMSLLSRNVPILTLSGLSKKYLAPGWRVGWIILTDHLNVMRKTFNGLKNISGLVLGANTIAQSALPSILKETPKEYYDSLNNQLKYQAQVCLDELQKVDSLKINAPNGAMYILIGLKLDKFVDVKNDIDFCKMLLNEQSVVVLPGQCFRAPNCFRIVFCGPEDILREACQRIAEFCKQHTI